MNNETINGLKNVLQEEDDNMDEVIPYEEDLGDVDDENNKLRDLLMDKMIKNMFDASQSDDNENDIEESLTSGEYHNKGTSYAGKNQYEKAIEICKEGLERFPNNMDLIADIIKYSADVGDFDNSKEYLRILLSRVPKETFNWRCFTFSIDYLVEEDPVKNGKLIKAMISDYKRVLPDEEKAYVAESEYEARLGNMEKSEKVLIKAIESMNNAPQCALKLLDIQLSKGKYEEALKTSNYYMMASCEIQPTTNVAYMIYARCLTEDAILHMRYMKGEEITSDDINTMKKKYKMICSDVEIKVRFGENIDNRIMLLDLIA